MPSFSDKSSAKVERRYVSRAGYKLDHALEAFDIDVEEKVCADLGSSTGGFVDCLLQNGAAKVYAVEKGYGTLDWQLRNDDKVVVMERQNAMFVELSESVDIVTIDVGWTTQKKIMPAAISISKKDAQIITLVKLHYEASPDLLRSGKLPETKIEQVLKEVEKDLLNFDLTINGRVMSPLKGKKGGNIEYLYWLGKK